MVQDYARGKRAALGGVWMVDRRGRMKTIIAEVLDIKNGHIYFLDGSRMVSIATREGLDVKKGDFMEMVLDYDNPTGALISVRKVER